MDKSSDKNTFFSPKRVFEFHGKIMDFTKPRVMGILNVTPDSFYDWKIGRLDDLGSGSLGDLEIWRNRYEEMISEGAYIIDIGAVSTRPGAAEVSVGKEKNRLLPVLREIRKKHPGIIISIDTYRAEIANIAAGEGADMINDISGGTLDPLMLSTIVHLDIPYVIMHMQGTPSTMQVNPTYEDVVKEVSSFLFKQAGKLLESGHDKIIIDPGFGFGKSVEHNFQLLQNLDSLVAQGYPVLAGLSRKSMINRVLKIKPEEALNGTTVLNTIALLKGASVLRVHDVKQAVEAIRLVEQVIK
jgi:dihydropteroate synthase